jgi:diguanylate cyclase (GGDEF)-like protein
MSDATSSGQSQSSNQTIPACPVGELSCPFIDEVQLLREQVATDPLTGLYNLRHFREALEQELERTQRTLMSTALMMVDLDHFKSINDTWGHPAGDEVLKQTARLIRDSTRKLDVQCRYGGEEFVIILPSTELMLAVQVAERLRENIASTLVRIDGGELQITASIGLALHSAQQPHSASSLIGRADHYLYQAKRQGRNQVCFEHPDMAETAVSGDEKSLLHDLFGGADSQDEADDFIGDGEEFMAADDSAWPAE